jgi:hypothetical protein
VNIRVQKVSAYFAFVFTGAFTLGFWVLAGFLPPPSPAAAPAIIAHQFQGNTTGIRVGMLICMFGAALLLPWNAAIAVQMRRAEGGRHPILTYTQIAAAACFIIEFVYPLMYWMVTAFRPTEAPAVLQHFDDLSWMCFLGVVSTAVVQAFAIGAAALLDKRATPVFPRWFAYFNFWCGTLFCPAGLIVFFKHGPFAWNGLISWWMVATVFFIWLIVVTVVLLGAIKHQAAEEADMPEAAELDLADQVASLSAQVTRLSSQLEQRDGSVASGATASAGS